MTIDDRLVLESSASRRARDFIRHGHHLKLGWLTPFCFETPLYEGQTIGLVVRCLGIRVLASCRVVYLLEEAGEICRSGFAYGTLDGHPECGEERFQVVWDHSRMTSGLRSQHSLGRISGIRDLAIPSFDTCRLRLQRTQ